MTVDRNVEPATLIMRVDGKPYYGVAYLYADHILLCHGPERKDRRKDVPFGKLVRGNGGWEYEVAGTDKGTVLCSNRWGILRVEAVEVMARLAVIAADFFDDEHLDYVADDVPFPYEVFYDR